MPGAAPRLPGSAFSTPSSPSSPTSASTRSGDTDSPTEEVVYPLSRPTSQTSFADAAQLYRSLQPVFANSQGFQSASSFTTATSQDARPPRPASPRSPRAQSTIPLAFHSLSTPLETASVPSSPTTASDTRSSMPAFPFLRRANSVTSVPILPPGETSSNSSFFGPFSKSRKLLANPSASASTNDLPSLERPRSPTPFSASPSPAAPQRPPRALERGASAALGPKAGARLLASQEAQRALRDAAAAGDGDDEFSIRERLAGGMVTPANAHSPEKPPPPGLPAAREGSRSGSGSSGRAGAGVRRVPVPPFDDGESAARPRREKSIQELTRRASQEERDQAADEDAARRRKASLSKASGAGLGSPFSGEGETPVLPPRKPRRPPVAGLNKAGVADAPDAQGRALPVVGAPRQRSSSTGSTASLSKDVVLGQLAEAVRREKKKAEMYERECEQGEKELAEIDKNLNVLKEKFATSLAQQEQVISNLRAEIDELESELERANELDEEAAQQYLDLLTASTSIETLKSKGPVVGAFDLDALRSSSTAPAPSPSPTPDKPKRLPFAFRRGLSLKRRVDTHVAAYDTVASNAPLPKPPLQRASAPPRAEEDSTRPTASTPTNSSDLPPRRARKLSKSRTTPTLPAVSSPLPRAAAPSPAAVSGFGPSNRPTPPPPAPVFPPFAVAAPARLPLDARPSRPPRESPPKQRPPPPVAGVSRARLFGREVGGSVSDGEREDGGVKGRAEVEGGGRKRTNSFKRGVQGTMRMLFPSHAPKDAPASTEPQGDSVQAWLRTGRLPSGSQGV
ncbi:hypothetical protein JCM10449v2_007968 [Rhodotorula kratochvilovae]